MPKKIHLNIPPVRVYVIQANLILSLCHWLFWRIRRFQNRIGNEIEIGMKRTARLSLNRMRSSTDNGTSIPSKFFAIDIKMDLVIDSDCMGMGKPSGAPYYCHQMSSVNAAPLTSNVIIFWVVNIISQSSTLSFGIHSQSISATPISMRNSSI